MESQHPLSLLFHSEFENHALDLKSSLYPSQAAYMTLFKSILCMIDTASDLVSY